MIFVGCQEEGISGEGANEVTQAPSPVLHPKAGPGNRTLDLPQILDSICGSQMCLSHIRAGAKGDTSATVLSVHLSFLQL